MPTIIENLEATIAALEATPDDVIDLDAFCRKTPCGTLYCALGLLTTVPHFAEQGLVLKPTRHGTRQMVSLGGVDQPDLNTVPWILSMFGEGAYKRLFIERGEGLWDDEILDGDWNGNETTDKNLALARLRRQLELYL